MIDSNLTDFALADFTSLTFGILTLGSEAVIWYGFGLHSWFVIGDNELYVRS